VVGAIVGADIYVASSFGAGYIGPASLLAWVMAGVMASTIALSFAQCAALLPRAGGSYAYVRYAWGPFAGFIVGWSLWLAEWVSLAVFPVAFTRYLMFFLPALGWVEQSFVKAAFVLLIALTNIAGVKSAGRTNDALTIIKMAPLMFFSAAGILYIFSNPAAVETNLTPLFPLGVSNFGPALVLIFWAYAGFELSTIPAEEMKDPARSIPGAITSGMMIVTAFYLLTNAVLFSARPWHQLATDSAPLISGGASLLSAYPSLAITGSLVIGLGALISIAGASESAALGTSRLAYALAADGLFPRVFAKVHARYKTPYLGIIIQSATALAASMIGSLGTLVATAVFMLAIAYAATCAAVFPLRKKHKKPGLHFRGGRFFPLLGVVFSVFLIAESSPIQILSGLVLLAAGVLIYSFFSP